MQARRERLWGFKGIERDLVAVTDWRDRNGEINRFSPGLLFVFHGFLFSNRLAKRQALYFQRNEFAGRRMTCKIGTYSSPLSKFGTNRLLARRQRAGRTRH